MRAAAPRCLALLLATLAIGAAHARSLVLYCSHDADACELAAKTFEHDTGIRTSVTRKSAGEFHAQIRAERAHPKGDVWYGGTIDPFLEAASEGLLTAYHSPRVAELEPWAQRATERSDFKVAAIYRIVLAIGMDLTVLKQKELPAPECWSDLTAPAYSREVELGNPVTSGAGYTILATLVTLYGEDGAFGYLRKLAPNVVRYTQSGTAQGISVARGEVALGVTFAHEFITQQLAGSPLIVTIPCEGTGYALGGMAILAGAPHAKEARTFYDWALSSSAQELANRAKNLIVPANAKAGIRPEARAFADVRTLDVDPLKFGNTEERRRLLARWQREIGDSSR